jgi:hypothetical protein
MPLVARTVGWLGSCLAAAAGPPLGTMAAPRGGGFVRGLVTERKWILGEATLADPLYGRRPGHQRGCLRCTQTGDLCPATRMAGWLTDARQVADERIFCTWQVIFDGGQESSSGGYAASFAGVIQTLHP